MKIIVYLWIERALYDTHLYNMYGLVLGGVYNTVEADGPATELNTRYSRRHRTNGTCLQRLLLHEHATSSDQYMADCSDGATETDVFTGARGSPRLVYRLARTDGVRS